jgi:hypothetical protein
MVLVLAAIVLQVLRHLEIRGFSLQPELHFVTFFHCNLKIPSCVTFDLFLFALIVVTRLSPTIYATSTERNLTATRLSSTAAMGGFGTPNQAKQMSSRLLNMKVSDT